tara:strand:+ start:177 stop:887 length:711 start_codon:yes stop_codon:yes gene_type:complete
MEPKKNPKAELENKRGLYFLIGLTVVLAVVLAAFEWKTYEKTASSLGVLTIDNMEDEMIPITEQNQPPPPPPPPPPQEIIEIVEDDTEIEEEIEIADSEADMNTEIFEQPAEVFDEPEIFTIVEDMPIFPGCENKGSKEEIKQCTDNEIYRFIAENTKYPAMARDAGISGTVYMRYLIDEKGEVKNVEVLRGVSGGKALDNEAERVIKMIPKMKPGKQRGKPVRVQYTVPVKFNLK